jgi:hypothetical protein
MTAVAAEVTDGEASSSTKQVDLTQRLDRKTVDAVLEVAVPDLLKLMNRQIVTSDPTDNVKEAARTVLICTMQRLISARITHQLTRRRLMPATTHTLSNLLCEALLSFNF